jgi:type I restriction enzyme S subunit
MSWSQREIQKLCKITRGASPRPIQNWMTEREDGIPWIKISDATAASGRTIERTAGRILREGEEKSVSVYKGDLILSNSATPGIPKFVGIHACIHDGWLLLRDFKDAVPEFLFYLLQHERRNLVAQGNGSVFTNLKTDILKNHIVSVPSIDEQKAIAHILGTLDDKIELNQKMNETLEEIAKAIFKSWFVDFDPVRAKADGRPTGLSAEISDLFPNAFEDSEIGEIPAAWGLQRLDKILELAYGKSLPATVRKNGNVPVYGSGGITGFHNEAHSEGASIIVGRKGTVGSLYWSSGPFFPIDTVYFVKTQSSLHYCFYLLKTLQLETMNTDAAVPGLNRSNAYRLEFASAPDPLISAFDTIATSLRDRMDIFEHENAILSELRDTLLPKLISGELRIPDAEKFLEEAGI